MKLCQECIDAVLAITDFSQGWQVEWYPDEFEKAVPDFQCEFPKHKELNEVRERWLDWWAKRIP
jgi:hypothetical protein